MFCVSFVLVKCYVVLFGFVNVLCLGFVVVVVLLAFCVLCLV